MQKNKKWSKEVTEHSHALHLKEGLFTWDDPEKIAHALLRAAKDSKERKGTVYQSAMSMLNFYINRAGRNLSRTQVKVLIQAKKALKAEKETLEKKNE